LRDGEPGLIPLERVDILDDLKSFVDVHRMSEFGLHPRITPTIELQRTEDELIIVFEQGLGQTVGQFNFVQLFNSTLDRNLRPIAIHMGSDQAANVNMGFVSVFAGPPAFTGFTADRRKASLSLTAATIGEFTAITQVAGPPTAIFFALFPGAARGADVPQKLLEKIVLAPGTGLTFSTPLANQDIVVSVTYKVQAINPTRPVGV